MDAPPTSEALEALVREHAALRRVATFVAQEPSPEDVFAVVTKEAGMLLGAQRSTLLRVVSPDWAEVVAGWSDGTAPPVPVGHRGRLDGRGVVGQMQRTKAPVRIEDFDVVGGEAAAYFLVSEALTNVAKHAQAESVTVDVGCSGDTLVVTIADDGVGGADAGGGSGLRGLLDRVDAVGGRIQVSSPPGEGTRLCARLPMHVLGAMNGH